MTPQESSKEAETTIVNAPATTVNKQALVDIAQGAILMFRGFAALTPNETDDKWAETIKAWEERLLPLVASDGLLRDCRDEDEAAIDAEVKISLTMYKELVAAAQVIESHSPQRVVGGPLADFAMKIAMQQLVEAILAALGL